MLPPTPSQTDYICVHADIATVCYARVEKSKMGAGVI